MTPWNLRFTRTGRQGFEALPSETDRAALAERLQRVARNEAGVDLLKLRGFAERYRVRSGRWRATIDRDKAAHTLWVIDVDDRKDAYR